MGGESTPALAHHGANRGPSVPTRSPARCLSGSPGATGSAASGGDVSRVKPPFQGKRLDGVPCPRTPGPAAPKKTRHASERDTPRVERRRARGRQTRRLLDSRPLIFVDESGLNLALTRLYARAPRGVRAVGSVPQNYGQSLTVWAALDCCGIRAVLLVPGATDQEGSCVFCNRCWDLTS